MKIRKLKRLANRIYRYQEARSHMMSAIRRHAEHAGKCINLLNWGSICGSSGTSDHTDSDGAWSRGYATICRVQNNNTLRITEV